MPKARFDTQSQLQSQTKSPATLAATKRQRDLIDILCNDAGVGSRLSRNDFISGRIGRKVIYLDELTQEEASQIIDQLKSMSGAEEAPEAERQVCSQCSGAGTICSVCDRPKKECLAEDRVAHMYSPVVCAACNGKRFELV